VTSQVISDGEALIISVIRALSGAWPPTHRARDARRTVSTSNTIGWSGSIRSEVPIRQRVVAEFRRQQLSGGPWLALSAGKLYWSGGFGTGKHIVQSAASDASPIVYKTTHRVKFSELDPYNHVSTGNYATTSRPPHGGTARQPWLGLETSASCRS